MKDAKGHGSAGKNPANEAAMDLLRKALANDAEDAERRQRDAETAKRAARTARKLAKKRGRK